MDRVAFLKRVPWFAELEESELKLVAEKSDARRYPKDSIVFHEGDPGYYLVVIVNGSVRVTLADRDGQETIIRELGTCECFGEVSLLDGSRRSATVSAVERTEVLQIARESFLALIKKRPAIGLKVMARLAADVRRATELIRTVTMSDLRGQVVRCHLQIALDKGLSWSPRIEVRPQPPRKEIARMIGRRPESVSRALSELYKGGYMTQVKGGVVVERRAIKRYWPPAGDPDGLR